MWTCGLVDLWICGHVDMWRCAPADRRCAPADRRVWLPSCAPTALRARADRASQGRAARNPHAPAPSSASSWWSDSSGPRPNAATAPWTA
eukprot:3028113-Rhodomonas_salina.2